MKQLKESLLDDFDNIVEKSDINMYLQKFWNVWLKGMDKAGCDAMGKPLKIGDIVIGMAAFQPMPAIIVDIKNKKIAVSQTGDCSDIKNSKGEIEYVYQPSYEFLKISLEALKAIYFTK